MNEAVKRALRTFLQSFIGVLIGSGILSVMAEEGVVDFSGLKKVLISAIGAGVVAIISFLQNYLEDKEAIPTVLK